MKVEISEDSATRAWPEISAHFNFNNSYNIMIYYISRYTMMNLTFLVAMLNFKS